MSAPADEAGRSGRRRRDAGRWFWRAGLGALLALAALLLARTSLGQRLEGVAEDARLRLRERVAPRAPHEALMLVGVDEVSLKVVGQWPFPRPMHGFLMDYLGRTEDTRPAVLAWDLLFVETSAEAAMDELMMAPLAALPYPVVMGAKTEPGEAGLLVEGRPGRGPAALASVERVPGAERLPMHAQALLPLAGLLEAPPVRIGFLDADAGPGGVVREIPLVLRIGDAVYPSLVLSCLLEYWRVPAGGLEIEPGRELRLRTGEGKLVRVPIDARGFYRLNPRHELRGADDSGEGATGDAGDASHVDLDRSIDHMFARAAEGGPGMPQLSYHGLYVRQMERAELGEEKPAPPTGGRIVLVGQVASGLSDLGPSALRDQSPKVLVHLNALDNILRGEHLRGPGPGWMLALGLGLGLAAAAVLDRGGYRPYSVALVGSVAVLVGGACAALLAADVMVPLALPLCALGLQQGVLLTLKVREERVHRDRVKGLFGTYVSPALVQRMVESGEEPRLGGVEEEITAYFSDIEGFSAFSEQLTPPRLVELMNEYLSACTDIVQAEGGTLDKYIGDALVAMYGAPLALPGHAHRAVVAALRVQKRCAELREKWKREPEKRWPEIVARMRTRIGLNTGVAIVGNMGSHTRFNYTMMGDNVNLAARMESGAKSYGVYTMVAAATRDACERQAPGAVLFRELDRIVVKGRSRPVAVYEAVALAADLDAAGPAGERARERVRVFEEGLRLYRARDWDAAERCFRAAAPLEEHPAYSPSTVLLERVARMRADPPPPDWDGVWRMTSK